MNDTIWGHPKEGLWGSDPPAGPNPYERHFQAQAVGPMGQEVMPGQVLSMGQEVKQQGLQGLQGQQGQQALPGQVLPGQAFTTPALSAQPATQQGMPGQQGFGGQPALPGQQAMPGAPFSQQAMPVPSGPPVTPAPGSFAPSGLSPGLGFGGVSPVGPSIEPQRNQFASHSPAFGQAPGNSPPFAAAPQAPSFSAGAPQSFTAGPPFSASGFNAPPDLGFSSPPSFSGSSFQPLGGSFAPFAAPGAPPESSETRNCSCGMPGLLLSVKKEGPNQGRSFFKCGKQHPEQPCGFFEWADEPPRQPGQAPQGAQGPQSTLPPGPACLCGIPSITLTVKKAGPNQGRSFFKCNQQQNQCSYFQWADQEPDPPGPPCLCGAPSSRRLVQKEGPNKGRPFMTCVKRACDYFAWGDEEPRTATHTPTPTPARAGGAVARTGDLCFNCHQPGHWSSNCPNKSQAKGRGKGRGRGRKKAGAAQEDDFGDDRYMPY